MNLGPFAIDSSILLLSLAHVVLGIAVLIVSKFLKGVLSPYRMDEEMTSKDNSAFGLAVTGYYLAVIAIYIGSVRVVRLPEGADSVGLLQSLGVNAGWSLAGIIALAGSRYVMSHALVAGARCSVEVGKGNVAAGAVECGVYIASGLILAGSLRQPGGTILTALVFFLLSQAVLLVFGRIYQALAGYGISKEICGGNLAAGTAFGLTLVSFSLLILKATSGEFVDWGTNLAFFGFDAVIGFVLLLALRWVTDTALLPNAKIADEIVRDRNVNVGLLEGAVAIGVGALILFVF